jgi:parallel beta-helix repeat protein
MSHHSPYQLTEQRKLLQKRFHGTSIPIAVLALLLFALVARALLVRLVAANMILPSKDLPHIYIRSDGSIDPSTAPIQRIGNVYTFTSNIFNYSIIIQIDNIVIDGAGYSLLNLGWGDEGIVLIGVRNVTIKNMEIHRFHYGIVIENSSYNNIVENSIVDNSYAVILKYGLYNNITKNVVSAAYSFGINLWMSKNTSIAKNRITNNTHGLGIWRSSNNTIVENYVSNNNIGILLCEAANNTIYHNNFIDNNQNVQIDHVGFPQLYSNFMDNGVEGNYWSNYNGVDNNNDGIGDTPYVINAYNIDSYPLIKPVTILDLPEEPKGMKATLSYPLLAMPEEYINYTIIQVNGSLWAKVEGTYLLYKIFGAGDIFKLNGIEYVVLSNELPLVYPTPPGTTNISVKFDETELNWSNYTETYPEALHHTAIGNWPMIYFKIDNVPNYFTLKIHYEHPIQVINGSYTLLYDLNLSPYLSPWCNKSTAYFSIRIETNYTDLRAYTVGPDNKWNSVNYTITKDGIAEVVSIKITSEYNKPLPGDLVIIFRDNHAGLTLPLGYAIVAVTAAVITVVGYGFLKRKNSSKASENSVHTLRRETQMKKKISVWYRFLLLCCFCFLRWQYYIPLFQPRRIFSRFQLPSQRFIIGVTEAFTLHGRLFSRLEMLTF